MNITLHAIALIPLGLLAWLCGWMLFAIGRSMGRDSLQPQLEMLWRYQHAVDNLDRWCGHTSPHAKLIARHLTAHGEGLGYNGGTPNTDEACGISGLREQLKRLDDTHAIPEVAAWRAARREVERATKVYNAALIEARAKDEVKGFGSTSVDAEYQAMNSASNAVFGMVRPMLAALDKA